MLFSIVTVCKDNEVGLRKTIESILSQTYKDWEIVLVVAKSRDRSVELAKKYAQRKKIHLVIQNGFGIYAAMNLGISKAKGEYINFLNSGDVYSDISVLEYVRGKINVLEPQSLLFGGYGYLGRDGRKITFSGSDALLSSRQFSFTRRACHQSMFFNLQMVRNLGGYLLQYRLASDFDLALRISQLSTVTRLSRELSKIERFGVAESNIVKVVLEKFQIRNSENPNLFDRLFNLMWTLFLLIKIYFFPNRN